MGMLNPTHSLTHSHSLTFTHSHSTHSLSHSHSRCNRPARGVLLPATSLIPVPVFFLLAHLWVTARVSMIVTVPLESAVALFVVLDDTIAAERLLAVQEAVALSVQPV